MNQPCQTGPAQKTSLYFFLSLAGDTHRGVGLLGQHSSVLWMNNNWTLQLLLDSANQCIAKLWKNCSAFPLTPSLHFFPDVEQGCLMSWFNLNWQAVLYTCPAPLPRCAQQGQLHCPCLFSASTTPFSPHQGRWTLTNKSRDNCDPVPPGTESPSQSNGDIPQRTVLKFTFHWVNPRPLETGWTTVNLERKQKSYGSLLLHQPSVWNI